MEPEVLVRLPYFSELPIEELKTIGASVQTLPLERGDVIISEGDASKGLYFVVSGAVKVMRISPEGREQVLTVVGAYQTFNEVPAFDDGTCPATAVEYESFMGGRPSRASATSLTLWHCATPDGGVYPHELCCPPRRVAEAAAIDARGRRWRAD